MLLTKEMLSVWRFPQYMGLVHAIEEGETSKSDLMKNLFIKWKKEELDLVYQTNSLKPFRKWKEGIKNIEN